LTLQKVIDICRANEDTLTQIKSFTTGTHDNVTDIHGINNYVIDVEIIILDSKCAQLLVQNAAEVDARIILPRCVVQNHNHFTVYI